MTAEYWLIVRLACDWFYKKKVEDVFNDTVALAKYLKRALSYPVWYDKELIKMIKTKEYF